MRRGITLRQARLQAVLAAPGPDRVWPVGGPDCEISSAPARVAAGRRRDETDGTGDWNQLAAREAADGPQIRRAFLWALPYLWRGAALPAPGRIYHLGRCGRCGRALTVPSSVESGFGPECAGRVGE